MAKALRASRISSNVVPIWQNSADVVAKHVQPAQPFRLTYVGHAAERHPLDALVLLATHYQARGDDVEFFAIGAGRELDRLRVAVEKNGLKNLTVRGRHENEALGDVLALGSCHLVSLANWATGTCVPSKTYAAMAAQRPVIYVGEEWGQAAKDVLAANCGYVVSHDDSSALVRAIEALRSGPQQDAMGRNGRAFFLRRRDLPVLAAEWHEFLLSLRA